MLNYPDNFDSAAFAQRHVSSGNDYPSMAEVRSIFAKHIRAAIITANAECVKDGPAMGEEPLDHCKVMHRGRLCTSGGIDHVLDYAVDGAIDALSESYVALCDGDA